MDHVDSAIFQHNYLSRMIRYDIQAAYRGTDPKTELIRAAGRTSRLMDPRRPKKLTHEQKEKIKREPAIQKLRERYDGLFRKIRDEFKFVYLAKGKFIHDQYQKARLDTYGTIWARERTVLMETQARYDALVPLQDVQEQINGNTQSIETKLTHEIHYSFPERFRLANVFVGSRSQEELKYADQAAFVDDLVSLCRRYETRLSVRKRKRSFSEETLEAVKVEHMEPETEKASRSESEEPIAKGTRTSQDTAYTSTGCKPFQRLICIGRTELSKDDLIHNYGSKDSLRRHFHRFHPNFEPNSTCLYPHPECAKVIFELSTDFLNHAARKHGIFMHEQTWLKLVSF